MSIVEALKDEENYTLRVVYGNRWMVWDGDVWIVYSKGYRQRRERAIIYTANEDDAVRELLKGMD